MDIISFFSDLFLFTKPNVSAGSYKLKIQLVLKRALYNDIEMDGQQNVFGLTQLGKQRLMFCASSPEKRAELKKDIEAITGSYLNARYSKFVEKERERSLRLKVSPVSNLNLSEATLEALNFPSFEDWKSSLANKDLPPPAPVKDDAIRFICHSPEHEQRVLKLNSNATTLTKLQDEIRKKFNLNQSRAFRIVYPRSDGSWEMHPINEQQDLDTMIELKISDIYLSWLT
jgi:hypothetical protein